MNSKIMTIIIGCIKHKSKQPLKLYQIQVEPFYINLKKMKPLTGTVKRKRDL